MIYSRISHLLSNIRYNCESRWLTAGPPLAMPLGMYKDDNLFYDLKHLPK